MRQVFSLVRLLLLTLIGFQMGVSAKTSNTFSDDSGSLEVVFPNDYQPHYGYHPVRIIAENKFGKKAVWRIMLRDAYGYDDSLNQSGLSRRIVVEGRQRIERELLLPMGQQSLSESYSSLSIEVVNPSGRSASWSLDSHYSGRSSGNYRGQMPSLLTERAASMLRDYPSPNDSPNGILEPSLASSDWRGYTGFSTVMFTADDWQLMTPASRQALVDWIRMGGRLQFVGTMPKNVPSPDVPGKEGFGLGYIHEVVGTDASNVKYPKLPSATASKTAVSPGLEIFRNSTTLVTQWLKGRAEDLIHDRFVVQGHPARENIDIKGWYFSEQ